MKVRSLMLWAIFSLFTVPALAGSGHDHDHGSHSHDPVSQSQAEESAMKSVEKLVSKRKIDESWKGVKVAGSEKKKFGNREEWVVVFSNESVSDPSKQKLYVFLSLTGDYIAANFTGK